VVSTFDGAGVLRGDLTPECAAAVAAVLEALGKKAGPEDTRTEGQRFHDALQRGCELLIRAKMVPRRVGDRGRLAGRPSQPLDIGHSDTIPAAIRRAVTLRANGHCEWAGGCDVPAAQCGAHHLTHQQHGGPTSVNGVILYCQFHHDIVIHRWGWQVTMHPDGTSEARSPDGQLILHSHAPPTRAA
jgi:hypothetical protein